MQIEQETSSTQKTIVVRKLSTILNLNTCNFRPRCDDLLDQTLQG